MEKRKNPKEPFVAEKFPDRPWQKVAMDLFKSNKWYLIITDYYSRYFEIFSLKNLTEDSVIKKCKKLFSRLGIPETVRTDPGTQFSTKFYNFSKEYDFNHITNSPKYSQSNGAVEAAVKIAKSIISKCNDLNKGLLSYRSTPLENGFSLAELLFSRKIRSLVPMLPSSLGTFIKHDSVFKKETSKKKYQENHYNKRHRTRQLSKLLIGDKVWIVDMQIYAEVIKIAGIPNSYILRTERGSIVERNRWHLIYAPYKSDTTDNISQSNFQIIDDQAQTHNNYNGFNEHLNNENSTQSCISDESLISNGLGSENTNITHSINNKSPMINQRPQRARKPNSRIFNKDFVCP